jgi:hypothetical protein
MLLLIIVGLLARSCLAFSNAADHLHHIISSGSRSSATQSTTTTLHSSSTFCAEADINNVQEIQHHSDNIISTTARGWMESIEQTEGPKHGVGAYTVLRCDATFASSTSNHDTQDVKFDCEWKIWGIEFHMDRLSSSFKTITGNLFGMDQQLSLGSFLPMGGDGSISSLSGIGSSVHTQSLFKESKEETKHVINQLLEHATRSIYTEMQEQHIPLHHSANLQNERLSQTVMLTILWTPSSRQSSTDGAVSTKPIVRGHAAFANSAQPTSNIDESVLPPPIKACVAIPKQLTAEALSVLPRRHCTSLNQQRQVGASANAKVSSWCRIRRPLEDPNRYKAPDVGEVLLVRQPDTERGTNIMSYPNENFMDTLEFLEGLISNLFVVYTDGTVRTAPAGLVLPGYARHLIIQELNERGLRLDSTKPPTMQDLRDGLWSEVFVTSAIRLVVPVEMIIVPAVGTNINPFVLWERRPSDDYPVTKSIRGSIYQRGCSQATVQHVTIYD